MLAELDRQVGRLVQATRDVGIYDETAFMLTSDHGMTTWDRTLIPGVLAAIEHAGYRAEIVTPGNSPAATTEVIIVPNAVRNGAITLRGRAATRPAAARSHAHSSASTRSAASSTDATCGGCAPARRKAT